MKKKYLHFFGFLLLVYIYQVKPEIYFFISDGRLYRNFSINTAVVALQSLQVEGQTTINGTIVCLDGVSINGLSAINSNCNFNTNPLITDMNPSITFGTTDSPENIIIFSGLLEKSNLETYIVVDENGMLSQKNIQFNERTLQEEPLKIDNIKTLYVTNITNYTQDQLRILSDNGNNITVSTNSNNNIQIFGNNIFLNFNTITTSNDPIYFLKPILNTQYQITNSATALKENTTVKSLQTDTPLTEIIFSRDLTLNTNLTASGTGLIDAKTISFVALEPIILNSSDIGIYGLAEANGIFTALTLDNTSTVNQRDPSTLPANNINSLTGQTLQISSQNNIVFSNNSNDILISSSLMYFDGPINTADNEMLFFSSSVSFLPAATAAEKEEINKDYLEKIKKKLFGEN